MRYVFANCEVDTQISAVRQGTKYGKLREKPFRILCYLLEHADRLVSQEELTDQFWPDHNVSQRTVHNTLLTVSRAIGDNRRQDRVIEFFPKMGYRVTVPVSVEDIINESGQNHKTTTETTPQDAQLTSQPPPLSTDLPIQETPARRQLTALFCDVVVSALPSTTVDPEDHVEAVNACHEACAAVITQYEGHVAQRLSDGFLAYFGYPNAHEDDAQRAVYSALNILEVVGSLNDRLQRHHQVRATLQIGIHTGLTIANDHWLYPQVEPLAFGETPAVAMRLQELLEPDTIGISAATYQLVAGHVSCRALGSQAVRGLSESLDVFQVLRLCHDQSRFGASIITRGLRPLIGRESEVRFLQRQWDQVQRGIGSVVCIRGEPGIGKSRLVQALKEQSISGAHMLLECQGSPYFQRTAFWPLTDWLEPLCQWEQGEKPEMKVKKLETALAQFMLPREETLALFADLLALSTGEGEETLRHMHPRQRRRRIMEALLTIIFELANQGPIVLIIEDLQWADSSTLDLLGLLVNRVASTQIFVLLIARADFDLPLEEHLAIRDLTLSPLTNEQIENMILQITQGKELPKELCQQLVSKSDGIPLFAEELTQMVLNSGLVEEQDDGYKLRVRQQDIDLDIPSTLHDSLLSRLDQLEIGQKTVQLAATIGREFSYPLMLAISTLNESTLQQELAHLVEAGLLHQNGLVPHARYHFKHALIQEAAYHTLSRNIKRGYHQQIAHVLDQSFPATCLSQPELLAHHYTEAGLLQQSVRHWQQATQQAFDRLAFFDAEAHAQKGLSTLSTLPVNTERFQDELNFQLLLCKLSFSTGKIWDWDEVKIHFQRAHELSEQVGTQLQRFEVLSALSHRHLQWAELASSLKFAEESLELAQCETEPTLLRKGHRDVATALFFLGSQTESAQHLRQALPENWKPHPFPLTLQHHQTAEAAVLRYQAWTQWLLGYPDQASQSIEEAHQLSQENALSLGVNIFFNLTLCQWKRATDTMAGQIKALTNLAQELPSPSLMSRGNILQGWSLAQQGKLADGIALMQQSITEYRGLGTDLFATYFLALLAELYGQAGKIEAGLETISEALIIGHQNGERCWETELHRLRAELLLKQTNPDATMAEAALHQALGVAREQQVKSLELRATTSLAKLWHQQGKRHQAQQQLAAIYSWFSEGYNTADVTDATMLLEELT